MQLFSILHLDVVRVVRSGGPILARCKARFCEVLQCLSVSALCCCESVKFDSLFVSNGPLGSRSEAAQGSSHLHHVQ